MAVWQFKSMLIPKAWVIEHNHDASVLYTEEKYIDTAAVWLGRQPDAEYKRKLSAILPVAESWNEDLLCWGDDKAHDIQVWYRDGNIASLLFRMDIRKKDLNSLIIKLVNVAKELDCDLFFPELAVIADANEFILKQSIQNSRAARFIKDPVAFMKSLAKIER